MSRALELSILGIKNSGTWTSASSGAVRIGGSTGCDSNSVILGFWGTMWCSWEKLAPRAVLVLQYTWGGVMSLCPQRGHPTPVSPSHISLHWESLHLRAIAALTSSRNTLPMPLLTPCLIVHLEKMQLGWGGGGDLAFYLSEKWPQSYATKQMHDEQRNVCLAALAHISNL